MSGPVKTHFIVEDVQRSVRTACGMEGYQCKGYAPRQGMPGEYDTSICDRFEATTFDEDVTCGRCLRTLAKLKRDN